MTRAKSLSMYTTVCDLELVHAMHNLCLFTRVIALALHVAAMFLYVFRDLRVHVLVF